MVGSPTLGSDTDRPQARRQIGATWLPLPPGTCLRGARTIWQAMLVKSEDFVDDHALRSRPGLEHHASKPKIQLPHVQE